MTQLIHTTVLLNESIDGLALKPGDIYLDGTLGSAGHAYHALTQVKGDLTVIGLDRDTEALLRSKNRLKEFSQSKIFLKEASYGNVAAVLEELKIPRVNRIMLDLGLSSDQFETSGRGFSFQKDEPLLMSFKKDPDASDITASLIVNTWAEETIADILYGYAEERYSRRIARAIVAYRSKKEIETTTELVEIISSAVPSFYRRGRIHPATRTFQALRIAVNDELTTLRKGMKDGFDRLASGGRMAIISFHSLEDRIVKYFYKEKADDGSGKIITKKPLVPTEIEQRENPRSRSAKLRIIEKI